MKRKSQHIRKVGTGSLVYIAIIAVISSISSLFYVPIYISQSYSSEPLSFLAESSNQMRASAR